MNNKIEINSKTFWAIVCTITILTSLVSFATYQIVANPGPMVEGTTYGPGDIDAYSFYIYRDGSTYYAKNGETRVIDYSNPNASLVIDNCVNALTNGGVIFLKKSSSPFIIFGSTTGIYPKNNIWFDSDGATIYKTADSGSSDSRIFYLENCVNVTIQNLGLYYSDSATVPTQKQSGIHLRNNNWNITIRRLTFNNMGKTGIYLQGTGGYIHIEDCVFKNIANSAGRANIFVAALTGEAPDYVWVKDCQFDTRAAIYVDRTTFPNNNVGESLYWHILDNLAMDICGDVFGAYLCDYSEIIGNTVHITSSFTNDIMNAIDTRAAIGVTISNNVLIMEGTDDNPANPPDGIFVGHGAMDGTISGNSVYGYRCGINIYGASRFTVVGNKLFNCSQDGIKIDDDGDDEAKYNVILGNSATYCADYGIHEISTADYNIVTACNTLGAGIYGIKIIGANSECHLCYNGTTWVP